MIGGVTITCPGSLKMDIYNLVKHFTSLGKARQVYLYSTFHTHW